MDSLLTVNYNDYYEKMRFQLTLRINIILMVILLFLGATFYIMEQPVTFLTLIGAGLCGGFIAILVLTKKYKLTASLFTGIGISMTIYTLLSVDNAYHFADPLWMLIVALFAYFTLGKTIGNIAIALQFLAIAYYIIFQLPENLLNTPPMTDGRLYGLAINCLSCAVVIALLIHKFLKRNAFAAEQYRKLTEELQQKNEIVEDQNREKTAMLKEIHHRVKNNLQVITSLLRLQSRDIENDVSVQHFKEAIDRIGAMALIHNQMYQSKDLNRIELEPYLRSLSKNILSSYTLNVPVKINFEVELEHTPSNMIVPIALLFNELISNSLKHAFKQSEKGNILVKIEGNSVKEMYFTYADDGHWTKPARKDSFGLELIDTLAQQLNGTVKRSTNQGTRYEFKLSADN